MQFLIIARDFQDNNALKRRLEMRDSHLNLNENLRKEGKMLYAGALTDEEGNMIGSCITCNFESRIELDKWLKIEPYIIGKVWDKIEILPFKVAPAYLK